MWSKLFDEKSDQGKNDAFYPLQAPNGIDTIV
jgi:hypothetical protein